MSAVEGGPQSPQLPQVRHLPAGFWAVLALTAALRSIGITRPLLGVFATKNAVYGMIARNFARGTADAWHPTLDVLAGGQRSWHLLEMPVSAYLTGWLWGLLGGSLDVWGRATSVAFSVGAVAVMFLLVRRRHGEPAATAAALTLALSPVGIIYGQSFMLEASLVFFTLMTFYCLNRWLAAERLGWLAAAGVCLALLLLTKIYMFVVLLPLAVMVFRSGRPSHRLPAAAVAAVAVLPTVLWYAWAYQTASPGGPNADRVFYSIRSSAEVHRQAYGLLGSADFYRQVLDDLTGVVLTPVGFMLALAGLLDRRWREHAAWLLAMLVLVVALPLKFHELNYYYMAVLPPLCIMVGLGWSVIRERVRPGPTAVTVLLLAAVVLSLRYSVRPAFVTPAEDRAVSAAARAVRELTAPDEPVITMHGTAIDLLYYCDRPGWAVGPEQSGLPSVSHVGWDKVAKTLVGRRKPIDPAQTDCLRTNVSPATDGPPSTRFASPTLHVGEKRRLQAFLEACRRQGARYLVVVGCKPPALPSPATCGRGFCIYDLTLF